LGNNKRRSERVGSRKQNYNDHFTVRSFDMGVREAISRDVTTISPQTRLFAMFTGWLIAFYGVRRCDVRGSIMAMTGLALAMRAMFVTENEIRS
jgi:uncharacterized membrane protein